jgi:plasmid stabilization system protein ParE
VATFRLSRLADADLLDIGAYTLHTWGEDQTIRYIDGLETCCQHLADNSRSGRQSEITNRQSKMAR